jgi:hypothetical protein
VVPEGGVDLDTDLGIVTPRGPAPDVEAPGGWWAERVLVGELPGRDDVALVGRGGVAAGEAVATATALDRLGLAAGDTVTVGEHEVTLVAETGPGASLTVATELATATGARAGWVTLTPPAGSPGTDYEVVVATAWARSPTSTR